MSKNNLRFLTLGIQSYAGISTKTKADVNYPAGDITGDDLKKIDPQNGIVVIFPEKDKYIQAEGDQGVGKTSWTECLKELAGQKMPDNAINHDDKDRRFNLKFIGKDGGTYHARATKTSFILEKIIVDEAGEPVLNQKGKEQRMTVSEPKAMLQELIGPAGTDPVSLRSKDGSAQIKWLRELYALDNEVLVYEKELNQKLQKDFQTRTMVNNEYKRMEKILSANLYYLHMEHWQKFLATKPDIEKAKSEMAAAESSNAELIRKKSALQLLENSINNYSAEEKNIRDQIEKLQKRLDMIGTDKQKMLSEKKKFESFISDNQDIQQRFDKARNEMTVCRDYEQHKQNFDRMMMDKTAMDYNSSESIRLTAKIEEYRKLKAEFVQSFTPDVPDMEVFIPDGIDEQREGIYYKGKPLGILAESELWEWFSKLAKTLNIRVMFVENISNLGTGAIDSFNDFIREGGYIFATMMNRKEKNMRITFSQKILS